MIDEREQDVGERLLAGLVDRARCGDPPPEAMDRLEGRLTPLLCPPLAPNALVTTGAQVVSGAGAAKIIGVLAVVLAVGGAGVWASRKHKSSALVASAPPAASVVQSAEPGTTSEHPELLNASSPSDEPAAVSSNDDGVKRVPGRSSPQPRVSAATAPVDGALGQARILEEARLKLSSDPARALELSEKGGAIPGGKLGAEGEIISIEALVRMGRTAEARARAEGVLRRNPDSPYKRRLDQLFGSAPPKTPSSKE